MAILAYKRRAEIQIFLFVRLITLRRNRTRECCLNHVIACFIKTQCTHAGHHSQSTDLVAKGTKEVVSASAFILCHFLRRNIFDRKSCVHTFDIQRYT